MATRPLAALLLAAVPMACNCGAPTSDAAPIGRGAEAGEPTDAPPATPEVTRGPDDPPLLQRDGRTRVDLELTRKKSVAATFVVPPGFTLHGHERRTATWAIEAPDAPPWELTLQAGCAGTCDAAEIAGNIDRHVAQLQATGVTPEFQKVLELAAVTMQTETVLDERIEGARLWGRMRTYSEPRGDLPPETIELHCFAAPEGASNYFELRLVAPAAHHAEAIERFRAACTGLRAA